MEGYEAGDIPMMDTIATARSLGVLHLAPLFREFSVDGD